MSYHTLTCSISFLTLAVIVILVYKFKKNEFLNISVTQIILIFFFLKNNTKKYNYNEYYSDLIACLNRSFIALGLSI